MQYVFDSIMAVTTLTCMIVCLPALIAAQSTPAILADNTGSLVAQVASSSSNLYVKRGNGAVDAVVTSSQVIEFVIVVRCTWVGVFRRSRQGDIGCGGKVITCTCVWAMGVVVGLSTFL